MNPLIDLSAIARNTAIVNGAISRYGMAASAVIKAGYCRAPIVRAMERGGIDRFHVSAPDLLLSDAIAGIDRDRLVTMAGILPEHASDIILRSRTSVHACAETIAAASMAARRKGLEHEITLSVRTRDDREGPADLTELIQDAVAVCAEGPAQLAGLQLNYGCTDTSPLTRHDVSNIRQAVAVLQARTGKVPSLSLGGSLLLPELRLLSGLGPVSLRVGEALLTGTIPGEKQIAGLIPTASLPARILECSATHLPQEWRILLNCGSNHFDERECTGPPGARHVSISTETSLWHLATEQKPEIGDRVALHLGYRSLIRCINLRGSIVDWHDLPP